MNNKIDILIMAAGASRRFGGCKLLTQWRGAPLITYALNTAINLSQQPQLQIPSINLVAGAYHDQIRDFLQQQYSPNHNLINNPNWSQGLGHSIAHGVSQLPPENSVLIMLADQPLVAAEDIQRIIHLASENPGKIICAEFESTIGVPAFFPAEFKKYLQKLTGDRGAKVVLIEHGSSLIKLPLNEASFDVDLPEDFVRDVRW
jgi:molybdenum cofactor cytidylyltransferase